MSNPAAKAKRQRQREAREFRKKPLSEQLDAALGDGFPMEPMMHNFGADCERIVLGYIGTSPEVLADLAERFPDDLAVAERPAVLVIAKPNSEVATLLLEAAEGGER